MKSFKAVSVDNTDPMNFPHVQEARRKKNKVDKRRAKNKVAKASRKANR